MKKIFAFIILDTTITIFFFILNIYRMAITEKVIVAMDHNCFYFLNTIFMCRHCMDKKKKKSSLSNISWVSGRMTRLFFEHIRHVYLYRYLENH